MKQWECLEECVMMWYGIGSNLKISSYAQWCTVVSAAISSTPSSPLQGSNLLSKATNFSTPKQQSSPFQGSKLLHCEATIFSTPIIISWGLETWCKEKPFDKKIAALQWMIEEGELPVCHTESTTSYSKSHVNKTITPSHFDETWWACWF